MHTTRATLLVRLKNREDRSAWNEFYGLYAPLCFHFARGRGLSQHDAEEIRDQCMAVIADKIGDFEYDKQKGGFKNWLYRMVNRRVIDLLRKRYPRQADTVVLAGLESAEPTPDEAWERHWKYEHLRHCVRRVRGSVPAATYDAFCLLVFEGCSAKQAAEKLGLTPNQVYKAKARVLELVREKLRELGSEIDA